MTEESTQEPSWAKNVIEKREGTFAWIPPQDEPEMKPGGTAQASTAPSDDPGNSGKQGAASRYPHWDEALEDFPVSQLPEKIKAAVIEVCSNDNIPDSVVAQAALSVVSIACQDLISVERRAGLRSVCSLFMLTVADSGARKTRAEEPLTQALRWYDRMMRIDHEKEVAEYEAWLKKAKTEERALVSAYTSLKRKVEMQGEWPQAQDDPNAEPDKGKSAAAKSTKREQDIRELLCETEKRLDELRYRLQSREKPRLKRLLYAHSAISDLERSLYENWPSAALLSNEGADIVLRRTESDMAKLDRLWDGQAIDVIGKRRQDNVFVTDPRLTMSIMIQPSVFDRFLQRKGERARGIGFMPRFLLSRPAVRYGARTIVHTAEFSTEWANSFNGRVWALLKFGQKSFLDREKKRRVLYFSPEAQRRWEEDYNEKERDAADDGKFHEERDFISRYSEHVARLAALFHCFQEWDISDANSWKDAVVRDEKVDQIGVDTLNRAIRIGNWYIEQYRGAFNPSELIQEDAKSLLAVLRKRVVAKNGVDHDLGRFPLPVIELRRYAPYRMRDDKPRFERALDRLVDNKEVIVFQKKMGASESFTEVVQLVAPAITEMEKWTPNNGARLNG